MCWRRRRLRSAAWRAWEAAEMEAALRPLADHLGLKLGQFFGTLRVAVTGKTVTPPLVESMVILGRPATMKRLQAARELMKYDMACDEGIRRTPHTGLA